MKRKFDHTEVEVDDSTTKKLATLKSEFDNDIKSLQQEFDNDVDKCTEEFEKNSKELIQTYLSRKDSVLCMQWLKEYVQKFDGQKVFVCNSVFFHKDRKLYPFGVITNRGAKYTSLNIYSCKYLGKKKYCLLPEIVAFFKQKRKDIVYDAMGNPEVFGMDRPITNIIAEYAFD